MNYSDQFADIIRRLENLDTEDKMCYNREMTGIIGALVNLNAQFIVEMTKDPDPETLFQFEGIQPLNPSPKKNSN